MKKIVTSIAAVAALLMLTACNTEEPATVSQKADNNAAVVKQKPSNQKDEPAEAPKASQEEAEGTAKLGDTVEVGAWSVTVTEIALNADDAIRKANMFNDKPRKGHYVLVTYQATYQGKERTADAQWDLSWSLTGKDLRIIEPASVVTPAENKDWPTETRPGGTVKHQVPFDIASKNLPQSILSVEGYTDSFDTVYADFAIN